MPYDILDQIEEDETINTCQQHNIKNCYAAGLEYVVPESANKAIQDGVENFLMRNDLCSYYLGVCTDIKFWQFAVTIFTLNKKGNAIASICRKEAMYCRFSPDNGGRRYVFYANWRDNKQPENVQRYIMLNPEDPVGDLKEYMSAKNSGEKQFALVTRIPTPDNTYYPIPYYGSLFKGKWYDIKKLIALAKFSKLKNAAPLKYLITIADEFWESIFEQAAEHMMHSGYRVILKDETGEVRPPDGYIGRFTYEQRTPNVGTAKTVSKAMEHAKRKGEDVAVV